MVAEVSISGGVSITANFDGNSIDVSVSVSSPINIIVQLGYGSDPTAIPHNLLTGRDAVDAHPIESISTPVNDNSNIYGWIRSTLLTGLAGFSDAAIVATDTVLQAFAKLQGQFNAVKVRLGLLEDRIVFDSTLLENVASISITTDKNGNPINFVDGDCFYVLFTGGVSSAGQGLNIQLNNIITGEYINQAILNGFGYAGSSITNMKVMFTVNGNTIMASGETSRCNSDYSGIVRATVFASTKPNSIPLPISNIRIFAADAITAGTRIIIRKC